MRGRDFSHGKLLTAGSATATGRSCDRLVRGVGAARRHAAPHDAVHANRLHGVAPAADDDVHDQERAKDQGIFRFCVA